MQYNYFGKHLKTHKAVMMVGLRPEVRVHTKIYRICKLTGNKLNPWMVLTQGGGARWPLNTWGGEKPQ